MTRASWVKVDEPCGFIVDKANGLIYCDAGRWLQEIGLGVDGNPCMSLGGEVADAADL